MVLGSLKLVDSKAGKGRCWRKGEEGKREGLRAASLLKWLYIYRTMNVTKAVQYEHIGEKSSKNQ